jgi:hypothetical protein
MMTVIKMIVYFMTTIVKLSTYDKSGHPGFMTIDNRTRSLLVSQPPEGFDASALEHFSRLVSFSIITFELKS